MCKCEDFKALRKKTLKLEKENQTLKAFIEKLAEIFPEMKKPSFRTENSHSKFSKPDICEEIYSSDEKWQAESQSCSMCLRESKEITWEGIFPVCEKCSPRKRNPCPNP